MKKTCRNLGRYKALLLLGVAATFTQIHVALSYWKLLHVTSSPDQRALPKETNVTLPKKKTIFPSDENCPFRDSPLYRSVFVYPSPGEPEWLENTGSILSESGKKFSADFRYPWQIIEERTRRQGDYHFRVRDARAIQYTSELLLRDILTHPESCLRSNDPATAALFFVPYLVSMEWHNGTQYPKSFDTSPYGQAILDAIDRQNYQGWETLWGYTSKFWKQKQGSDHILVMSEGCHGLLHPHGCGGSSVFVSAQKQLSPPIIVYKDTSKSFVEAFPKCAAKNIVVPAPNPDGRWFNGRVDTMAKMIASNASFESSPVSLANDPSQRPLAYYYNAGNHGSCRRLRQSLETSFECSPTGQYLKRQRGLLPKGYHFPHAMRHATFCPCPGGDTPNSKRYFDAVLAGCIPLTLSSDFVWPFSLDIPGTTPSLIHPEAFSIRLNPTDFSVDNPCDVHNTTTTPFQTIQNFIQSIPREEIARLQKGLRDAAHVFRYYEPSPTFPDNPLQEHVLPNGGAAHALVQALADRAYGQRWPACQQELLDSPGWEQQNYPFKC